MVASPQHTLQRDSNPTFGTTKMGMKSILYVNLKMMSHTQKHKCKHTHTCHNASISTPQSNEHITEQQKRLALGALLSTIH